MAASTARPTRRQCTAESTRGRQSASGKSSRHAAAMAAGPCNPPPRPRSSKTRARERQIGCIAIVWRQPSSTVGANAHEKVAVDRQHCDQRRKGEHGKRPSVVLRRGVVARHLSKWFSYRQYHGASRTRGDWQSVQRAYGKRLDQPTRRSHVRRPRRCARPARDPQKV